MKFGGDNSDFGRDDNSDLGSMASYRNELGGGFKFRDTISELYDDKEKDAVFRSSMKKGGADKNFNETLNRMSPEQMRDNLNLSFKAQPLPDMTKQFRSDLPKDFGKPLKQAGKKSQNF